MGDGEDFGGGFADGFADRAGFFCGCGGLDECLERSRRGLEGEQLGAGLREALGGDGELCEERRIEEIDELLVADRVAGADGVGGLLGVENVGEERLGVEMGGVCAHARMFAAGCGVGSGKRGMYTKRRTGCVTARDIFGFGWVWEAFTTEHTEEQCSGGRHRSGRHYSGLKSGSIQTSASGSSSS